MSIVAQERGQAQTGKKVGRLFVEKRDGRKIPFDEKRIRRAIVKAFKEVYSTEVEKKNSLIESLIWETVEEARVRFERTAKIYELQAIVEHVLLEAHEYEVAQAYIDYRVKRDFERTQAMDLNYSVGKLLQKDRTVVNENANKDSDVFNTQRDLTAGMVGKSIGLKFLPPAVANAHLKGDIHYHDLDYHPYAPMTNCCLIDFENMLSQGFRIGNAEVESPRSIQTATAQIA